MSFLASVYGGLLYIATAVFSLGLLRKIVQYSNTPAPLKIPTMPAPLTNSGVMWRLTKEVLIFESLFRSDKWLWFFSILFHVSLALVLLRHIRYLLPQDWTVFWNLVVLAQPFGKYAAFSMLTSLLGLMGRRLILARIRYISNPSDILLLLLLIGIGVSGIWMTFLEHTDIIALKRFLLGLITFSLRPVPTDILVLLHISCVGILMTIFPFSKLLHFPGLFFSPTRNQSDNTREKRHVVAWIERLNNDKE